MLISYIYDPFDSVGLGRFRSKFGVTVGNNVIDRGCAHVLNLNSGLLCSSCMRSSC